MGTKFKFGLFGWDLLTGKLIFNYDGLKSNLRFLMLTSVNKFRIIQYPKLLILLSITAIVFLYFFLYSPSEEKGYLIKANWISTGINGEALCVDKINVRTAPGKTSPKIIVQSCSSEVWVIPQSEATIINTDGTTADWVKIQTNYQGKTEYGWVNKKYIKY